MNPLEVWGGVECTINRLGERFYRQLDFSGHAQRLTDLELIADLGIRTLRHPVLWEATMPADAVGADWTWADASLRRLRALRIAPIVGLVHHGSGPQYTSLVEDTFAPGLAAYAAAVAQRYPWIDAYTPVNEPLTTARFSALYGLWYPHQCDTRSFLRALVNQCQATVLAMQAIRAVNPTAKLVQTDDLGKIYSTPGLAYQAEFENERRWLSWDLLCGMVNPHHRLWKYLLEGGVTADELHWFNDHPCPPDVIGLNHYVTSDRFLHQNRDWCPQARWGGNATERYADVEAVRVLEQPAGGVSLALREAWQRYRLPIAITEAHLGCTREEQLRWLLEVWQAAHDGREQGIDVRAVTAWALFGSFDWNTLLTSFTGRYEPGAFDVRGPSPRPTAVAQLVKDFARRAHPRHAVLLSTPGWWRRPARLSRPIDDTHDAPQLPRKKRQPLLIVGATGTLGRAFGRICEARDIPYRLVGRAGMDIGDARSIDLALEDISPWAVINAAGYVHVDAAEHDRDRCYRENSVGAEQLAAACALRRLAFLTFSSDLVFDGCRTDPYTESHRVAPLNVYGMSKACAEAGVLQRHPAALVVRTSAFFGPWDQHNFVSVALSTLAGGDSFIAFDDVIISPTYVPDLANVSLDLLIDDAQGLWHLANRGALSWAELARRAASKANISTRRLVTASRRNAKLPARRPPYSALGSERGALLPDLDDALDRYIAALAAGFASPLRHKRVGS